MARKVTAKRRRTLTPAQERRHNAEMLRIIAADEAHRVAMVRRQVEHVGVAFAANGSVDITPPVSRVHPWVAKSGLDQPDRAYVEIAQLTEVGVAGEVFVSGHPRTRNRFRATFQCDAVTLPALEEFAHTLLFMVASIRRKYPLFEETKNTVQAIER
jgi:hypothetical protein